MKNVIVSLRLFIRTNCRLTSCLLRPARTVCIHHTIYQCWSMLENSVYVCVRKGDRHTTGVSWVPDYPQRGVLRVPDYPERVAYTTEPQLTAQQRHTLDPYNYRTEEPSKPHTRSRNPPKTTGRFLESQ